MSKFSALNKLENETVVALFVSTDQTYLRFKTLGGDDICYEACGDCCSISYIYEILGVENLLNAEIHNTESRDLGSVGEDACIATYSEVISTPKGYCDIIYRNESNGYYGGSLNPCHVPDTSWISITANFEFGGNGISDD